MNRTNNINKLVYDNIGIKCRVEWKMILKPIQEMIERNITNLKNEIE